MRFFSRTSVAALVTRSVAGVAHAVIAQSVAKLRPRTTEAAALRELFPDDLVASAVLKAASSPTTLAGDTALGRSIVADLLTVIGPVGAGARLLQAGLQFVFDSNATVYVPGLEARADHVSFVGSRISLPRKGRRVGLRIVLFEGLLGVHSRYGLHTRAVTVYRDTLTGGFSHFVTSTTVGFRVTAVHSSRRRRWLRIRNA